MARSPRLCRVRGAEGANKEQVLAYRAELYQKMQARLGTPEQQAAAAEAQQHADEEDDDDVPNEEGATSTKVDGAVEAESGKRKGDDAAITQTGNADKELDAEGKRRKLDEVLWAWKR